MNFVFTMHFIAMFIAAVLFLTKLRWPKKKSIYDIHCTGSNSIILD